MELGGYQLRLDNWKLEAFNEDSVYVRYNDVYYMTSGGDAAAWGIVTRHGLLRPRIDRVARRQRRLV